MIRRICSTMLALCLTVTLCVPAMAASFSDVAGNAWYHEAVAEVSAEGLMNGTSETAFSPDADVTRGMVAAVLWRLEGSPQPEKGESFPDVAAGDYFAQAAAWCAEHKITSGYDSGLFGGKDPVTREQLALFLQRYAQYTGHEEGSGVLDIYPDAGKVHAWAKDGMAHAVGIGLITGRGDGTLDPLGTASRAQLAVILQRLMIPAVG